MSIKIKSKILLISFLLPVIILMVSCQSLPKKSELEPVKYDTALQKTNEVKLQPGDVLEIRFFYTPELNTVQTIRPDGKISMQLVGEVIAEGKTPSELKNELYVYYSKRFKQLDITIIVQSLNNRRVFVGGQVPNPGPIPMPGKLTALEAIMLAGGIVMESGRYDSIIILRNENGKWVGGRLNLKKVLEGKQTKPYYLKPLDIVYVPETYIYKLNRWINQNINRILPSFGISYTLNPNSNNPIGITTTITPNAQ